MYVGSQAAAGVPPDKRGSMNVDEWKAQRLADLQSKRITVVLCCCNDGSSAAWRPFESHGIRCPKACTVTVVFACREQPALPQTLLSHYPRSAVLSPAAHALPQVRPRSLGRLRPRHHRRLCDAFPSVSQQGLASCARGCSARGRCAGTLQRRQAPQLQRRVRSAYA